MCIKFNALLLEYSMRAAAILVTFNELRKWDWVKQAVIAFREHLGDTTLVVVDHNHVQDEQEFLKSVGAIIIEGIGPQQHGDGLDNAALWCYSNNYEIMVHFEPDCVITGSQWWNQLVGEIENGYWMAGSCRFQFGAIHPCPSAWLVSKIPGSFNLVSMGDDVNSNDFKTLLNPEFVKDFDQPVNFKSKKWHFHFRDSWDTGLKNWFECARLNKASWVNVHDIKHLWAGRTDTPLRRFRTDVPFL